MDTWSREAPLMPPRWFWEAVAVFAESAHLAAAGDVEGASERLSTIREREANWWYDEHAQNACYTRVRAIDLPRPASVLEGRRATTPDHVKRRIYQRDHYHCRHCGLPTIPTATRKALQQVVGDDVLPWSKTNATQHGLALAARTEYDHVVPMRVGGANDESNLVTACASCNYGKHHYTLEELGLDDPRLRPPAESDWDGLTSLIPLLRQRAAESPRA
jgi:5-methylcytosine-specific restriction endonuclease McrA